MQSDNPLLGVWSNDSWACRFGSHHYIGEYPFHLEVWCPDFLCSTGLHMSTHNSWTDNGLRMKNMTWITPAVRTHFLNMLILTTLHSHLGQHRPLLIHISTGASLHIHAKHPHPNRKHLPCQCPSKRAVTFGQWSINGSSPACRQISWALHGHCQGG